MTSAQAYEEYDDLELGMTPAAPVDPATRAVIYLRVSSAGQVNTDYDPEGISIPAQRVACRRKAEQLGLTVVDEYVEPGRSGTEMTKRLAFQQMLTRVRQDKDVGTVIVHKLSRMARNRYDDAIVMADLRKRGIALISATEGIDDSPVGQLMHGILATFNEYQSRESGADIAYKMGQKAKNGGTLGRARIGYLNATDRTEGREIRTVIIDPERAELVKLAFELYATGGYALDDLVDELYDRGLRTRATRRRPEGPLQVSTLHQVLRDRYYLGKVTYKGEEYQGRHPALIDPDLFAKVQDVIQSRATGDRQRVHNHYLKGNVYCGECRERDVIQRLAVQHNINRHGTDYLYYFCRHKQTKQCHSPHMSVIRIEDAIEDHYAGLTFSPEFVSDVRDQIAQLIADENSATRLLKEQLTAERRRLDVREGNLLDLAADGTMPQTRIRQKLREINDQRERLSERLTNTEDELSYGIRLVEACLKLLERPQELYRQCSDTQRRLLNQALFTRIFVHHERGIDTELREPFAQLAGIHHGYRQGRDDAPPPSPSSGSTAPRTHKKAVPTSGDGLLRSQLQCFIRGMAPAQGCNNPPKVDANGTYYNPRVNVKALVNELELLIVKLPAPADPARPTRDPLTQTIRQLRASQLAGIIADYQAGATVLALANKYGFNRNTIPTILKRAGVRLRSSGLTEEQIDQAVRLYEQGQSLARIGDRFGVDAHTVRRRLLERGVAMRPAAQPSGTGRKQLIG